MENLRPYILAILLSIVITFGAFWGFKNFIAQDQIAPRHNQIITSKLISPSPAIVEPTPIESGPTLFPSPTPSTPQGEVGGSREVVTDLPSRINIPKISVSASMEYVGLDQAGRMDVPKNIYNVAWYKLGVKPGDVGNAVIAGHLDGPNGVAAVFYNLDKLQVGDIIEMTDKQSNKLQFRVTKKAVYEYNNFPLQEIFGSASKARLNLITCEGTYNRQARNYSHRLVIYSELI